MKSNPKISLSKDQRNQSDKNKNEDQLQNDFSEEWNKQMALKNEAILKSIEELVDQTLKGQHD